MAKSYKTFLNVTMNTHDKLFKFKFGDFLAVFVLLAISLLPYFYLIQNTQAKKGNDIYAIVKVDSKKVKTFDLTKSKDLSYTIRQANKYNTIVIRNHKIAINDANCRDQVCVKEGFKSKAGESIICLPHKVSIELVSDKPTKKSQKTFDHTLVNP